MASLSELAASAMQSRRGVANLSPSGQSSVLVETFGDLRLWFHAKNGGLYTVETLKVPDRFAGGPTKESLQVPRWIETASSRNLGVVLGLPVETGFRSAVCELFPVHGNALELWADNFWSAYCRGIYRNG